jgi:hypothetical protein
MAKGTEFFLVTCKGRPKAARIFGSMKEAVSYERGLEITLHGEEIEVTKLSHDSTKGRLLTLIQAVIDLTVGT